MKALLVNDASLSGHHGSLLVTERITELGSEVGIGVARGWSWRRVRRALAATPFPFDIIIVNGEGSLHHDSKSARAIADIGIVARERKIPAYLINASEEANSRSLREKLGAYRKLYLRDSASQTNLSRLGVTGSVVPDLSMTWPDAPMAAGVEKGPLLVTDVSDNRKTERLIRLAAGWTDCQLVSFRAPPPTSLRRIAFEAKRALTRLNPRTPRGLRYAGASRTRSELVQQYLGARAIVCGRYHSLCFALRMRLPFLAIDGNSAKSRSLLADVGLGDHRLTTLDALASCAGTPAIPSLTGAELEVIDRFLARARASAQQMFADIVADARDLVRT